MCKNGYNVVFQDDGCQIQKGSKIVIAARKKIGGNMYHLEEDKRHCLFSLINDRWLWHWRMCPIKFDNLIKINSSSAVRDLPRLTKSNNKIYKECQEGKQTRGTFKRMKQSSIKLLDLVHIELCSRTRIMSI